MNYAVITGDIVESSRLSDKQKAKLNQALKDAFGDIKHFSNNQTEALPQFNIFRGDSFQGLLADLPHALKAAILIRALLRNHQPDDIQHNWDARIAIGIGEVDYLPENISEGDGEAYQNSGPVLDNLKTDFRSAIQTSDKNINNEFKASCALLDAVIAKWTPNQAETVAMLLKGMTPKEMSKKLDISQAAIHYRMKGAGWFAVEALLNRYNQILSTVE